MRHIGIVTLFPDLFLQGPLNISIFKRALDAKIWSLDIMDLRDHGIGKHKSVDDTPAGGGSGMILRPDAVDAALKALTEIIQKRNNYNQQPIQYIYLSPRGIAANTTLLNQWRDESCNFIFLCGRYEGVDQRVLNVWNFCEVCVGNFVVAGGEVPCMMLLEGFLRLLPGVVHDPYSLVEETFQDNLMEYDLYTQPRIWNNHAVPDILYEGHHAKINEFRKNGRKKIFAMDR